MQSIVGLIHMYVIICKSELHSVDIILIYVAIECPPGMVYQQCGPLCPQTCDNIGTSDCHGGCAEGCFCPDGQVMLNGRCINTILCQGTIIHT